MGNTCSGDKNGSSIVLENKPAEITSVDNNNSYKSIALQQKLEYEDIIDVLNADLKKEKERNNLLTFKLELLTNMLSVEESEKKIVSKRLVAVQHYILNSDQMSKSLLQSLSNFQPSSYITKEDSKESDNELNHKQIFNGLDIEGAIKRCRDDFEGINKANIINSFVDNNTRKIIPLWTREDFMIALYKFTTTITRMDTQIIALRFYDGKFVSVPEFLEFFGNTSSKVRIAKASIAAFRLSSELLKFDMNKENISKKEDKGKSIKSTEGSLKVELNSSETINIENDTNINKENVSNNNNKIDLVEVIGSKAPVKPPSKPISKPNSHVDLKILDKESVPEKPPKPLSKHNSHSDLLLPDNEVKVEDKIENIIIEKDNVIEPLPKFIKEEEKKEKEAKVLIENNLISTVSSNDDVFIILHKIEMKRDSLPSKSLWSLGKSLISVSIEYGDNNWKRSTESIEDIKKKLSWKLEVGGDNTAVSVNPKINNKLKVKINDKNNKIIGQGFIEIPHDLASSNMNRVLKCVVSYADLKINASPIQIDVALSRIVKSPQSPQIKKDLTMTEVNSNSPVELLTKPKLLFPEKNEEKEKINEIPVISKDIITIDNDENDNDEIVKITNENETISEEKDDSISIEKDESIIEIKKELFFDKEKESPRKPPRNISSNQLNISSELDNTNSNTVIEFDDINNSTDIYIDSKSSPVKIAKEKYKNELSNIINDVKNIEKEENNFEYDDDDDDEEEDNGVEDFRNSDLSISQQSVQVPKLNFSTFSQEEKDNTTGSIIDTEEETNTTQIVDIEDNNIQDIEELDDFDDVVSFEEE